MNRNKGNKILLAILLFFIVCSVFLSGYNTYLYLSKIKSIQNSLVALQGSFHSNPQVIRGKNGTNGHNGTDSQSTLTVVQQPLPAPSPQTGATGATGGVGLSAYDLWIQAGNTGTIDDFLASLVGPAGPQGESGVAKIFQTRCINGTVQWQYVGDFAWQNLFKLSETESCL